MNDVQTSLIHTEKLIALGNMAATLIHEIRNPLISIGGFANKLHKQLSPDSSNLIYVDKIIREVKKLENLIDGIVHFSNKNGYTFSFEDPNKITEEAVAFFVDEFSKNRINLIKKLSVDIPPIDADRQQLKLAFNNLIINAIQAMENGGTLTIQTRYEDNWVIADICDTGGGIDPSIINNIFNPFYTTKKRGTGLGLSIAHSIVTNHKGIIEVNNNIGIGATFSIKLPVVKGVSKKNFTNS